MYLFVHLFISHSVLKTAVTVGEENELYRNKQLRRENDQGDEAKNKIMMSNKALCRSEFVLIRYLSEKNG